MRALRTAVMVLALASCGGPAPDHYEIYNKHSVEITTGPLYIVDCWWTGDHKQRKDVQVSHALYDGVRPAQSCPG